MWGFLFKYRYHITVVVVVLAVVYWIYSKGKAAGDRPKPLKYPTGTSDIPTGWTPVTDVLNLHAAMDGWGTDEDAIYSILENRTRGQKIAIYNEYQNRYKTTLLEELESELDGDELQRALASLQDVLIQF